MIIEIMIGLGLGYLSWSLIAMEINYRRAAAIGIPLVRLPVDPMNLVWLILEPSLWNILDKIPIDWGTFGRYSRRGCHFHDKATSHLKYGPVWALVTPCDIYIYFSDPDAIHDIFMRRTDFLRPSKMYKLLEVYGPCISTASLADWPRHRKVLATPFNESIMKFVWDEALSQAKGLLELWTDDSKSEEISSAKDTRTLSLNVLAATGFRKSYKFDSASQTETSYRDALQKVLDNVVLLMLVSPKVLQLPFMPKSWTQVGRAAVDFKVHMEDMLNEETQLFEEGKMGSGTLMTSFVRALGVHQKEEANSQTSQPTSKGLTIDEIFGNIFVINFAGHDTTANTLAFTMILLAAYPDIQDWVSEEVNVIINDERDTWEYETLFGRLKRCRAVLLETLRQFPPIMALPRWSNDKSQVLRVGDQTIVIPPNTGVMPSILAVQMLPKYWEKPLIWNPKRWISVSSNQSSLTNPSDQLDGEEIITPSQSTFFPWSDGLQNCPGQKFSQVEFVAVIAVLLRDHRVNIVRKIGESLQEARERALAVTQDCNMELLLRMKDADQVRLVWAKAEKFRSFDGHFII
ncbi:cytochrome P450 [Mollisia scopiformis]|uniref:Cytochrome P450 n=1 Tax=Mollisia scopiformis TaxID=149040 RepID=A0A194X3N5_MOLSC|nr:cytochrome P450 [Mollisia scopiformis]KUJ14432.1 cytochrome P450 [Mollisia scopiformis]